MKAPPERSRTKQKADCTEVRRLMKSARCLSHLVDSLLGAVLIIPGSLASCVSLLLPHLPLVTLVVRRRDTHTAKPLG